MNAPAVDITTMLASDISELQFGTNLFVGVIPDSREIAVGVTDTGGFEPENLWSRDSIQRPTVQVMVRGVGSDYRPVYDLAREVFATLHLRPEETISGARYLCIYATSDIGQGRDEENRHVATINFRLDRTASA